MEQQEAFYYLLRKEAQIDEEKAEKTGQTEG